MTQMTQVPSDVQFVFRPTGRTRRISPEFGKSFKVPEIELIERRPANGFAAFDAIAEVEGHGYFYVSERADEYDGDGAAVLLSRTVAGYDAGDNKIRSCTAPQSTQGVCAPRYPGGPSLLKGYGDAEFAAAPGEYTGRLES